MAQEFSAAMGQDAVCCPQAEGNCRGRSGHNGGRRRHASAHRPPSAWTPASRCWASTWGAPAFLPPARWRRCPPISAVWWTATITCKSVRCCARESSGGWQAFALNDVVLYSRSRLHPMDYAVYCDGICVGKFRSDGVILATPTGSTAYSLSAGGPILDVTASVFVLTAICPHGGQAAPLVFSDKRRMTIVSSAANRDTRTGQCRQPHQLHAGAGGLDRDIYRGTGPFLRGV